MSASRAPWRVLLDRQWLLAALGVVVAIIACVLLGLWQFGRYETKSARADLIAANYDAEPAALDQLLASPSSALPAEEQWRTAELTGRYCTDPACVLYVRNRPYNGQTGFFQLVPFRTDEGTLLVVRGWVPTEETQSLPLDPPPAPTGDERIVVRMRPAEPVLADRTNPAGQIQSVSPELAAEQVPGLTGLYTGAYGELVSEDPSAPVPTHPEKPDTSLGPHLSYAVQWWLFALFFPVALVIRARRAVLEAREDESGTDTGSREDGPSARAATAVPRAARSSRAARPVPTAVRTAPRRRSQDEEDEDALLDDRTR